MTEYFLEPVSYPNKKNWVTPTVEELDCNKTALLIGPRLDLLVITRPS